MLNRVRTTGTPGVQDLPSRAGITRALPSSRYVSPSLLLQSPFPSYLFVLSQPIAVASQQYMTDSESNSFDLVALDGAVLRILVLLP